MKINQATPSFNGRMIYLNPSKAIDSDLIQAVTKDKKNTFVHYMEYDNSISKSTKTIDKYAEDAFKDIVLAVETAKNALEQHGIPDLSKYLTRNKK